MPARARGRPAKRVADRVAGPPPLEREGVRCGPRAGRPAPGRHGPVRLGIAAADLLPDDPVAREIALVVCDYDLWLHRDPRLAVLGQVLQRPRTGTMSATCWPGAASRTTRSRPSTRDPEGDGREIDHSISHVQLAGTATGLRSPRSGYPSETAAAIRERLGTGIEVIVSPGGRFSIRSVPPISRLVARRFGGGGHPHAAGGDFEFTFLDRLGFTLLKRNRRYRELVVAAEALEPAAYPF